MSKTQLKLVPQLPEPKRLLLELWHQLEAEGYEVTDLPLRSMGKPLLEQRNLDEGYYCSCATLREKAKGKQAGISIHITKEHGSEVWELSYQLHSVGIR